MRTNTAIKKSVNVTLAQNLLEQAQAQKLNLSAVLTEALLEKFRANARATWLKENQKQIEAINQFVDEHGSFSDYQRAF